MHWICNNLKVIVKRENEILNAHFDTISFYLLLSDANKPS